MALMANGLVVAPSPPPRSIKAHLEPLQLSPHQSSPWTLTLLPHAPPPEKSRRHAIDGRPELLVTGEQLLDLLTSFLASRSARTRDPAPEASPSPAEPSHTRTATEARPPASISFVAASP
jgi:hypothetical protein